jgi:hypothetical protein
LPHAAGHPIGGLVRARYRRGPGRASLAFCGADDTAEQVLRIKRYLHILSLTARRKVSYVQICVQACVELLFGQVEITHIPQRCLAM